MCNLALDISFAQVYLLCFLVFCQDPRAGRKLIDNPPITEDEAVRSVKTYQLVRQALAPRRRGVHSVSRDIQLSSREKSRSPPPTPCSDSYGSVRHDVSQRQESVAHSSLASNRGNRGVLHLVLAVVTGGPGCAMLAISRGIFGENA